MELLKTVKASGITVAEFACLCGVSRVTVYNWANGGAIHELRKPRLEKLLDAIVSATKTRDLPPKTVSIDRSARIAEIKATVVKHLKKGWPVA